MWSKKNSPLIRRGFTFLETMITLGIFLIFFVGILGIFTQNTSSSDKNAKKISAYDLAYSLISEAVVKNFTGESSTIGPDGGESRFGPDFFDDIDDYDNYTESPPRNAQGNVMNGTAGFPDYSNFNISAAVEYVDENMTYSAVPTDYKRMSVTVRAADIPDTVISEVKVNATQ